MTLIGKLGRDEGSKQGPEPGDGANVVHTEDVEGTRNDELPDYRGQAARAGEGKADPARPER